MPTFMPSGDTVHLVTSAGYEPGLRLVKDIPDLYRIPEYSREIGMLVFVQSRSLLCTLLGGKTNACWQSMPLSFTPLPPPPDETPTRFEREID